MPNAISIRCRNCSWNRDSFGQMTPRIKTLQMKFYLGWYCGPDGAPKLGRFVLVLFFFLSYPRPPGGVRGRHLLEQPPEGRSKQILHQQRYEIDAVALTTPFPDTVARRMSKRLDGYASRRLVSCNYAIHEFTTFVMGKLELWCCSC